MKRGTHTYTRRNDCAALRRGRGRTIERDAAMALGISLSPSHTAVSCTHTSRRYFPPPSFLLFFWVLCREVFRVVPELWFA